MKNLFTLVKMQLKEKLNIKKIKMDGKNFFNIAVSILGEMLKFAIITALCGVVIFAVQILNLFSLTGIVPASVMSILFSIMLVLSVFSCTVGLTKAMYFSRDNAILLTLPCKPIQVYLSKLIIFAIFEFKKSFSFVVPLFVAYFITHGYEWYFYPWLILCYVFISLLTVSIGALLSVPTMWIMNVFRQHRYLQVSMIVVSVAAAIFALFYAISLIPPHIDLRASWSSIFWNIQNFLKYYTTEFSGPYNLTLMIVGEYKNMALTLPIGIALLKLSILIGISIVCFVVGILVVQPLFYKMASKPFEYLKKQVAAKKNKSFNPKVTGFINEFLKVFKDSSRMFFNVAVMISIPILIYFLNKVFFAMNTKDTGDYMVIAFNVLIILLIALNANAYAASIFSRDGRSAYLIKVQPTNPALLLVSKLLPNTLFCIISFAITFVILLVSTILGITDSLLLIFAIFFIYLAHLMYCAQTDIMNPQTEIYATMGEHENNPNENKATISAFIISFLVCVATLLLLAEGSGNVFTKLFFIGLGACIYETWLFFSKIKLYYKEK